METMEIKKENVTKAYNEAQMKGDTATVILLETLFGKEALEQPKPKDVTERIKTFEDAVAELGEEHPFVVAYRCIEDIDECGGDIEAYIKLRIIVAALNEGWEPQFTEGEIRWYYWYELITKEEYDQMDDDDKSRVVGRGGYSADAYSVLVYAFASSVSSSSFTGYGSRLAFKSEKLAEYAAKQFIEIFADFCFRPEAKSEK